MKSWFLLIAFFLMVRVPISHADNVYVFVVKKSAEKKKNRWTLADWLATKERMRAMDMWLAMNSPSPFEFFISGDYQWKLKGSVEDRFRASLGAYASIVGLQGEYESFQDRILGSFNLRLIGYHVQATNLTLKIGLKSEKENNIKFLNLLLGADLTLYLIKFFGVQFIFHYYWDSFSSPTPEKLTGLRYELQAFIDFKFLRVFGGYVADDVEYLTQSHRSTFFGGAKLFF